MGIEILGDPEHPPLEYIPQKEVDDLSDQSPSAFEEIFPCRSGRDPRLGGACRLTPLMISNKVESVITDRHIPN